jgi:hypothetical protein
MTGMRYRREPAERGPEPGRRGGAWVRALSIDMPYGFVARSGSARHAGVAGSAPFGRMFEDGFGGRGLPERRSVHCGLPGRDRRQTVGMCALFSNASAARRPSLTPFPLSPCGGVNATLSPCLTHAYIRLRLSIRCHRTRHIFLLLHGLLLRGLLLRGLLLRGLSGRSTSLMMGGRPPRLRSPFVSLIPVCHKMAHPQPPSFEST